jgi:hypothetical protein
LPLPIVKHEAKPYHKVKHMYITTYLRRHYSSIRHPPNTLGNSSSVVCNLKQIIEDDDFK